MSKDRITIDDINIVTKMNKSPMAVQQQMVIHQEDDVTLSQPPTHTTTIEDVQQTKEKEFHWQLRTSIHE